MKLMKESKLIFYLDKDNSDLYFTRKAINSLGHRVNTFLNGYHLLQALRNCTEQPDLIFLDIDMPILNDEEILNVIKNSDYFKHIPIVIVSVAYPKKLVRHLVKNGANHLIKKTRYAELKIALAPIFLN